MGGETIHPGRLIGAPAMKPVSQCAYTQSMSRLLQRPNWCQKKHVNGLSKFLGSEVSSFLASSLTGLER
jgi:hypothetical protein